jgi:Glycosyl transferase family 2
MSDAANFELIVQDNSTDDRLGEMLAAFGDPRIRYAYTAEPLNMHQNFDRAIAHASGRYVCALGDDDAILVDEALRVLARAREGDLDAVLTGVAFYYWPGVRHRFWGDMEGLLTDFDEKSSSKDRILDPRRELERVFGQGVTAGLGKLPRVYQGFVSRRSLEALYARCGTHFPGASPDMANAVALAAFVNGILWSDRLVIVSGYSPHSGGGAGTSGQHHGRLEDQAHLPRGTLEEWDQAIPRFWSGVTIYAQSAVSAARAAFGTLIPSIAYHRLYAACLVYQPRQYHGDVLAAARAHGAGPVLFARTAAAVALMLIARAGALARNLVTLRPGRSGRQRFRDTAEVMAAGARRTRAALARGLR